MNMKFSLFYLARDEILAENIARNFRIYLIWIFFRSGFPFWQDKKKFFLCHSLPYFESYPANHQKLIGGKSELDIIGDSFLVCR